MRPKTDQVQPHVPRRHDGTTRDEVTQRALSAATRSWVTLPLTSGRDVRAGVEKLGSEIRSVRPGDRSVLSDLKATKVRRILERLKDRSPKLFGKIDLSLGSIFEPKPKGVVLDVASFDNGVVHGYFSGSIGSSGSRASARFQF